LYSFTSEIGVIGAEQAGFKRGHSTLDHVFVLKTLIDLYLAKRKRLYCCFIDYKKAFDTIARAELWQKVLRCDINGKILDVVRNMYSKAKSCVVVNNCFSDMFACNIGVRQGENLSPLLFAIYLSDLETFLARKYNGLSHINQLTTEHLETDDIVMYLKLYILLYADDTAVLAESPAELQSALDAMHDYCNLWKLSINTAKTKIVIFSRGKVRNRPEFKLGGTVLEYCDDYAYLGVTFNYNGKFNKARKCMYDKASRAMFALLGKYRRLNLPISLNLFMSYENCDLVIVNIFYT
jgi:hypothetical protein